MNNEKRWNITGLDAIGRFWHASTHDTVLWHASTNDPVHHGAGIDVAILMAYYEEKEMPLSLTTSELEAIYDDQDWGSKVGLTCVIERIPMGENE